MMGLGPNTTYSFKVIGLDSEAEDFLRIFTISSAECYNVLSPFFENLSKWGSKFAILNLV